MIGRADIEGSKSNVAMNAWLPQLTRQTLCVRKRAWTLGSPRPSRRHAFWHKPPFVSESVFGARLRGRKPASEAISEAVSTTRFLTQAPLCVRKRAWGQAPRPKTSLRGHLRGRLDDTLSDTSPPLCQKACLGPGSEALRPSYRDRLDDTLSDGVSPPFCRKACLGAAFFGQPTTALPPKTSEGDSAF